MRNEANIANEAKAVNDANTAANEANDASCLLTISPLHPRWCLEAAHSMSPAGSKQSNQPTPPPPHTRHWAEQGVPGKCSP